MKPPPMVALYGMTKLLVLCVIPAMPSTLISDFASWAKPAAAKNTRIARLLKTDFQLIREKLSRWVDVYLVVTRNPAALVLSRGLSILYDGRSSANPRCSLCRAQVCENRPASLHWKQQESFHRVFLGSS